MSRHAPTLGVRDGWPRTAMMIAKDIANNDRIALGIEIVNNGPFMVTPEGLHIATCFIPLDEIAEYLWRSQQLKLTK